MDINVTAHFHIHGAVEDPALRRSIIYIACAVEEILKVVVPDPATQAALVARINDQTTALHESADRLNSAVKAATTPTT